MKQVVQRILGMTFLALALNGTLFVLTASAENAYTSVIEYNQMEIEEKYQMVSSALSQIYTYYSQTNPDLDTANCILDLFNNPDREINGYDHLGVAVQVALTNENPDNYPVESILLGIINTQCETP